MHGLYPSISTAPQASAHEVELKRVLDSVVTSIRDQLREAVRASRPTSHVDSDEIDAEHGLLSCYSVSAKSGLNCKEVVEHLQLRIAHRYLYLGRVHAESATKIQLGAPARPTPECCK